MANVKTRLSAAVVALVVGGASAPAILDQLLEEKEGNRLTAYQDGSGIWTICRGITRIDGRAVERGMSLTAQQCREANALENRRALAWVAANVSVPLSAPQQAGIASFCPYNLGPAKCFTSTFYRRLNAGDRVGACAEIKRWVHDRGRDCRLTKGQANGCYGQVERRDQESALACWGLDK